MQSFHEVSSLLPRSYLDNTYHFYFYSYSYFLSLFDIERIGENDRKVDWPIYYTFFLLYIFFNRLFIPEFQSIRSLPSPLFLREIFFTRINCCWVHRQSNKMAGMLPGVESARRRRCWGSSTGWCSESPSPGYNHVSSLNCTRRSSLCLYTSNHNSLLSSTSAHLQQRSMVNNRDEKLAAAAREAKERLDEKLRAQYRKSEPKRRNSQERVRVVYQDQVNSAPVTAGGGGGGGLKKSASKRMMSWVKLSSWKSSEQDECAVCLEQFRDSENLAHLPCAHRFHSGCLVPWLENNAHCPCCRAPI